MYSTSGIRVSPLMQRPQPSAIQMEDAFHQLAPDGDVILVVQAPSTAFAVWAETQPATETDRPKARMRVSSSHLTLASAYFKVMFRGDWKEKHTLSSDGSVSISMEHWPSEMLILMNIIHGHTFKIPRALPLEKLAKLAVLVDYYQCFEVVEVYSEMWINHLNADFPKAYSRDLILWICISEVFRRPEQYKAATRIAIRESHGPIPTLGLPITTKTVDRIEEQRQKLIDRTVKSLHNFLISYCKHVENPSDHDFLSLGVFTLEMMRLDLLSPRPKKPFRGHSFERIAIRLHNLPSQLPSISSFPPDQQHRPDTLSLSHAINGMMDVSTEGLVLEKV
ncbi:hypothetical protein T310_0968 [Rasamsonia emersonii CBS 393.64]|uniref:BTB domain-containing protein n=1 Tax=Rasamsonia emersonii (strain ATCC 16479 / CBS 393.64 / IMI 116815) TaxID=1408163 RepID=A0A0F4Z3A4_RASE3|nr:hypothetical protein T310_0968 [Rasamsonia emersonii CBS 393.64]KKA24987.1 hypothetical protein T310_0968 [Rasamsonia emersonii CBS 393.64]